MENIQIGLLLMVVGMTTVFAILLIVINLGKGLIFLVNKYVPEDIPEKKKAHSSLSSAASASQTDLSTTAAIVSAISIVTRGKGKVTKIEKL